jgi:hypothetical protein
MKRMLEFIFVLLMLVSGSLAIGNTPCSVIDGNDARAPLPVDNGALCFKLQPALDSDGNVLQEEGMWTYIYFIRKGQEPVKAGNLERGKIEDAFNLDVNKDGKKEFVVIHSEEIRSDITGSCMASPWYSIFVFKQTGVGFEYDSRTSRWFGSSADIAKGSPAPDKETCDYNKLIYAYPYKTRDAIEKALTTSPFVGFTISDTPLSATLAWKKTWLYEAETVASQTNKYLIAGDKVIVNGFTKNLCFITYSAGKKPLQMWLKCDALKLNAENNSASR